MNPFSEAGVAGMIGDGAVEQAGNQFAGMPVEKSCAPAGTYLAQVGERGPVFRVDVVRAVNVWFDKYQDAADMDRGGRYSLFVQELGGGADHNAAEALLFFNKLFEKSEALKKSSFPELFSANGTGSPAST